ncbi:hypothetical protein FOL47_010756, partial [Perkinsus chesapeaki]
ALQNSLKVSKSQIQVIGVTHNRLEIYMDLIEPPTVFAGDDLEKPADARKSSKTGKGPTPSADELYVELDLQLQDSQSPLRSRSEFSEYLKSGATLQRLMVDERWAAECMKENQRLGRSVVLDGTGRKQRKVGYEPPAFDPMLPGTALTEDQGLSTLDASIRALAPPGKLSDDLFTQTVPPSVGAHKGDSAWYIPAGPFRTPSLLKDEDLANHRMYTFYDVRSCDLLLQEKFNPHAKFFLTRHPLSNISHSAGV